MSPWLHGALWLSLSPPLSLSLSLSIAPGRFSRLHPVSLQNWCMYVLSGRPTQTRPCGEVHTRSSLMCSPSLIKQCLKYLVFLNLMICEIRGTLPNSYSRFCFQEIIETACSIIALILSTFFSMCFFKILVPVWLQLDSDLYNNIYSIDLRHSGFIVYLRFFFYP